MNRIVGLMVVGGVFLQGCIGSAWADELNEIRSAAEQGVCTIPHEGVNEPAVALTASAYDLSGVDQPEVIGLIKRFLSLGCSIHEEDSSGTSPVNVSILTGEPELLKFILQSGGNPYGVITKARPWANGKNSFEFAELVYRVKKEQRWQEVVTVLDEYRAMGKNN